MATLEEKGKAALKKGKAALVELLDRYSARQYRQIDVGESILKFYSLNNGYALILNEFKTGSFDLFVCPVPYIVNPVEYVEAAEQLMTTEENNE